VSWDVVLVITAALAGVGVGGLGIALAVTAGRSDAATAAAIGQRAEPPARVAAMGTATAPDTRVRADLRNLRAALDLSQLELAQRSGLDVRTVRRVENDTAYRPRLEQLLRMADALGADVVLKVRE
jgi:DNA-binding XRE family transcriptional regulator